MDVQYFLLHRLRLGVILVTSEILCSFTVDSQIAIVITRTGETYPGPRRCYLPSGKPCQLNTYRLPCPIPLILTNARLDLSGPEHHESWYPVSSMSWVTASCFARFVAASLFAPWPIRARHHLAFSGRCMSCPVMWHCLCPLCQRRSNLFSTSVREFA